MTQDDRRLVTNCTYCGEVFGPPPTGPVYDDHLDREFEDFWVHALGPENYAGDYKQMNAYHLDCWKELRARIAAVEHYQLEDFT